MAPWEELFIACDLIKNTPEHVIDILTYLISSNLDDAPDSLELPPLPDHYFFHNTDYHWQDLLGDATTYFHGEPFVRFTRHGPLSNIHLTMRTMIRGGDNLVKGFLDWLAPYSRTQGVVGFTRCDESRDYIYLIRFEERIVY